MVAPSIWLQVLVQVDGDVDAAIEFLVAEQAAEEYEEPTNSALCHFDSSFGNVKSSIFLFCRKDANSADRIYKFILLKYSNHLCCYIKSARECFPDLLERVICISVPTLK